MRSRRMARLAALAALVLSFGVLAATPAATAFEDSSDPVLVALGWAPTSVDATAGADATTISMEVTDDVSGFSFGALNFRSPSGDHWAGRGFSLSNLVSGDSLGLTMEFSVTWPQYTEPGTWTLYSLYLQDAVGNRANFTTAALAAAGFPTTIDVTVNEPPVADANGPYTVDEGSTAFLDSSGSWDPDGDALTFDWDLDDDGTFETSGVAPVFSAATLDDGLRTVSVQVCDGEFCDIDSAIVQVLNVAPGIDSLTAPIAPVALPDQPISVIVGFSDPGVADTHTVTWDWGDTNSDSVGSTSPATGTHTYAGAGVYEVTVTMTDDDGGTATATYQYIVVYDPDVDGDGVLNDDDVCPATPALGTATPEKLKNKRYAVDATGVFVDNKGTSSGYTITDTAGCDETQVGEALIEAKGKKGKKGKGPSKSGLTSRDLKKWVDSLA